MALPVYGSIDTIKAKVAGTRSTQITTGDLEKAQKYGSSMIKLYTGRHWADGEDYFDAVTSLAEEFAYMLLLANFNLEKAERQLSWEMSKQQCEDIRHDWSLSQSDLTTQKRSVAGAAGTPPLHTVGGYVIGVRHGPGSSTGAVRTKPTTVKEIEYYGEFSN
jgi:hypothetical protein